MLQSRLANSQVGNRGHCGEEGASPFVSLPGIFVKWILFLPQKRLAWNVPETLDIQREFDPS